MKKSNRITRKSCLQNYVAELIMGATFITLLILYKKPVGLLESLPIGLGGGTLFYSFFKKSDLDERDHSLFYRVNHFTLAATIAGIVVVKLCNDVPGLTDFINVSWAQMVISVYFFFHGLFGLILFLRK